MAFRPFLHWSGATHISPLTFTTLENEDYFDNQFKFHFMLDGRMQLIKISNVKSKSRKISFINSIFIHISLQDRCLLLLCHHLSWKLTLILPELFTLIWWINEDFTGMLEKVEMKGPISQKMTLTDNFLLLN